MNKEKQDTPPIFMRMSEVSAMIGLKPAAIDRAVRAGRFPAPFLIGVKAKAWDREEINQWRRERDEERSQRADPARPSPLSEGEKAVRVEARWGRREAA